MKSQNSEFDAYADGYAAGMENPLKKIVGKNPNEFLMPKIHILTELFEYQRTTPRVLDFGCGTGEMLALLAQAKPEWTLIGADISQQMIKEAEKRHLILKQNATFLNIDQAVNGTNKYDVIYASCVFHHIAPGEWVKMLKVIANCLEKNGALVIFEHNPWNPITKWVVNHTEIDKNANLFSAATAGSLIKEAGMYIEKTKHFMYLPPSMAMAGFVDRLLGGLPLGGQYVCVAKK